MVEAAERVLAELLERTGEAKPRPRLEPVARLAKYLGDPQTVFKVIHVGGTNGKTSTARAIEIILRSYGLRTGLFTSPHLIDFTERIRIDGEPISDHALEDAWEEMQPALQVVDEQLVAEGQSRITFFEALAVLAFTAFADAPVDVAVIEVGMGGEWDATNIVDSAVQVFTPIALDHTSILGGTLEEIAATKSGIMKPGGAVVSARQDPGVTSVLRQKATETDSRLSLLGEDFFVRKDTAAVGGRVFTMSGITGQLYEDILLPLFGEHQSLNTALAVAAVEAYLELDSRVPEEILEAAMANLSSPGRLQILGTDPLVLVDSAHNPAGMDVLLAGLKAHFTYDELCLVFGAFSDKDLPELLGRVVPLADRIHLTAIANERSTSPEALALITREIAPGTVTEEFDSSADAIVTARQWALESEGRIVLIVGSVHLAGEAIEVARRWQK